MKTNFKPQGGGALRRRIEMKRFLSICCALAALALMALPFGITMDFAPDPELPMELETFHSSYLSTMPIENLNWMPVVTAVLTLGILVLLVAGMKKDRKIPICICLIVCISATFVSWSVFSTLTIVGAVVFALHFALLAIQLLHFETQKSEKEM